MNAIYDDIEENTESQDLSMSRWLMLFIMAVCIFVFTLGLFNAEALFGSSGVLGGAIYVLATLISYGLYVLMLRWQRYPSIYAAFSFLSLGMATYLSGLDEGMGIIFSVGAVAYIVLYGMIVKFFNIYNSDA